MFRPGVRDDSSTFPPRNFLCGGQWTRPEPHGLATLDRVGILVVPGPTPGGNVLFSDGFGLSFHPAALIKRAELRLNRRGRPDIYDLYPPEYDVQVPRMSERPSRHVFRYHSLGFVAPITARLLWCGVLQTMDKPA